MKYFDELKKSMNYLAASEKTIFIGQAVEVPGTSMTNTLKEINPKKLLELPVAEEMQMGITTGLALDGNIPVSIFPRWNFVLLAMNQLINHLDKVNIMSNNGFKTKAIIRTGVGSQKPLHPQYQHIGDFTDMVRKMCSSLDVIQLNEPEDIFPSYKKALDRDDGRSTILVEFGDYHNEK
tara:strand:+ start:62 stop:598 length:537 start_codon:yes stop_codon:yes gene_type:complete